MINIVFYLIAYFLAAVPFGLVLARLFAKVDIRSAGSGSIGATNVLRVVKESNPALAKKLSIATIALDALKGLVPLVVAKYCFGLGDSVLWAMAVLAVIGHCFSPYLLFNGGKGIATGAGVMIFFLPLEVILALIVWFVVGKVLKISSLASLSALVVFIASSFIIHPQIEVINTHAPVLIICFIIVYKHWENILRLITGKEKKVI